MSRSWACSSASRVSVCDGVGQSKQDSQSGVDQMPVLPQAPVPPSLIPKERHHLTNKATHPSHPKMAPKNKQSKGKDSGDAGDKGKGGGGLKAANSINVRHILVRRPIYIYPAHVSIYLANVLQCEKHSKKEQAVEKLRNGSKFDDVAREFSEDKARQGMYTTTAS